MQGVFARLQVKVPTAGDSWRGQGEASLLQHCCLMRLKAPRAQQPKCLTSVAGSKVP